MEGIGTARAEGEKEEFELWIKAERATNTIYAMIDENDKIIGDSGKLPLKKSPTNNNEGAKNEDKVSSPSSEEVDQVHHGKSHYQIVNQLKASGMSLKEKYDALRDRDTTFVFVFGPPGSGKSGVTSTLAFHMGTDEEGELRIRDEANISAKALLQDIFRRVKTGNFLERTDIDKVYEIDLVYKALAKKREMRFTFLEMSGENLKAIEITPNAKTRSEFIPEIDLYLSAPKLDLLFFLVVDYNDAGKWDGLVVGFLDYIAQCRENHRAPKVILLISKWDGYKGRHKNNNDVTAFAKENMPMTYGRLNAINGVIDYYTVGEVKEYIIDNQLKAEIISFNPVRAPAVKRWMYHAVTGQRLPTETSLWDRFLSFIGL